MAEKIQLRRDTAANWASSNPVLSQGELGYVTDTKDVKFGDDTTAWNSLTPWTPNATSGAAPKLASIGSQGFGTSVNSIATNTAGTGEMMFVVTSATTGVTAQWNHFYTSATGSIPDTDPAGSIVFSASLKVVSTTNPGTTTGTLYRLTFNGRTSVTLDPGGKITADLLGLSLAAGDVVAIRTYLASGTAYPPRSTWGASAANIGGFTAATDLTAPGSAAISGSTGNYYGPHMLLGYPTGTAKSVLLAGDSIGFGFWDYGLATVPSLGLLAGFALRALTGVASVVNIAIQSDTAQYFLTTTGSFRRLAAATRCNSAIIEYGSNDLAALSSTAAQVEASNVNIATELRRMGIAKVFLSTILPRTTSTDHWATTTNQTPVASESNRVAYNTWVRAGCPVDATTKAPVAVGTSGALLAGSYGHPITGSFDTAATVESSLNSGKWLVPNRVVTGSITSGTYALTSSTANFQTTSQETGGDLGSAIMLAGAGAAGAYLTGYISAVGSSTSVTLDAYAGASAGTTVSATTLLVGVMTTDGVHPSPRAHYLMSQAINAALL